MERDNVRRCIHVNSKTLYRCRFENKFVQKTFKSLKVFTVDVSNYAAVLGFQSY